MIVCNKANRDLLVGPTHFIAGNSIISFVHFLLLFIGCVDCELTICCLRLRTSTVLKVEQKVYMLEKLSYLVDIK